MIFGVQAAQKSLNLRLPRLTQLLTGYVDPVWVRESRQLCEARKQVIERGSPGPQLQATDDWISQRRDP